MPVRCAQVEGQGLEGQVRQRPSSLWRGYQQKRLITCLQNIEPEAPSILPEILPRVGAENEKEEENSDVDISDVRGGLLDKWKQHEQYSMGMRLAELSVMWHVNGWSNPKFPCFLA